MRFARGDVRTTSFRTKTTAAFLSAIDDFAAVAAPKNQLSRDFLGCSIFDVFDSIDPQRTLTPAVQRSKAARECELIYPKLANAISAITPGGSRRAQKLLVAHPLESH
jgi:hypothetical protein